MRNGWNSSIKGDFGGGRLAVHRGGNRIAARVKHGDWARGDRRDVEKHRWAGK